MITQYSQYKNDLFNKLGIDFKKGKKILDVGCGPGTDAEIFVKSYGLNFYGVDLFKHENITKNKFHFRIGGIHKIPYKLESFEYVFTHDVLHHVDEENPSDNSIVAGLKELRRVCKKNGYIIILEANRYNPLFYPHMVLMKGHNHLIQSKFKKLVQQEFAKDIICFNSFEAHSYPSSLLKIFKIYEFIAEHCFPKQILAYNVARIKKS